MAEQAAPTDQVIRDRDFRLNSIQLIGSDGVAIDISALVVELSIRQDIFANYMNGNMLVVDGMGMLTNRGVHGSEYLLIDIHEPGRDYKIKKAFRIFKVSNREAVGSANQRYLINFVSDEMVHSNLKRVTKAYKKTTIAKIVEDILINSMGISKYRIEPTNEQVDVVIPSWRPTEAINWLARRAERGRDRFCFLFYENLDGFFFRSLHSIYLDNPLNGIPYVFEAKSAQADMAANKFTIDSFQAKDFDVVSAYNRGATSMRFLGIDPVHRTVTDNQVSLNSIPRLHKHNLIDNVVDPGTDDMLYEQYDALRLAHIQTTATQTEQPNNSELWVRHIQSLAMLNNSIYKITMPGNLEVQAGRLVELAFPNFTTPTITDDTITEQATFLVTAVVHTFNIPNGTFDTRFSVTRDSAPEMPTLDSSLPAKVRDLNEK